MVCRRWMRGGVCLPLPNVQLPNGGARFGLSMRDHNSLLGRAGVACCSRRCTTTRTAVSRITAPAWCSVASGTGTTNSNVVTPRMYWQTTAAREADRERGGKPRRRPNTAKRRHQHQCHGGQQAVVELHCGDILGQVAQQRLQRGVAGWHQPPVHQRKRIIVEAGMQPGHEPAGHDGQRHQSPGRPRPSPSAPPA